MSVRKLGFALIDLFDIFLSILFPLSHPLKFIFLSLLLSKVASSDEIFQGPISLRSEQCAVLQESIGEGRCPRKGNLEKCPEQVGKRFWKKD